MFIAEKFERYVGKFSALAKIPKFGKIWQNLAKFVSVVLCSSLGDMTSFQ